MKKGVELIYKLNGNIDDGIDVFELAPTLLSFAKLINEAHNTIYPEEPEIAVNVKPFSKGSFEINIWMFAKDVLDQIWVSLTSDTGIKITALLAFLGLVAKVTGVSLRDLISFLRGKKLEKIEPLKSGEYQYTANDNSSIIVGREVNALYVNPQIQLNIYNGIAKPLELPNVNTIDSYIKGDEEKTKVVLTKDILQDVKAYASSQIPLSEEDKINESIRTIWVHPIRANLEGGPRSWSFRIGSETTMTANISDDNFLREIETGEIRLAQIDQLLVDVLERQVIRGRNIVTTYEIVKVKSYIKGLEQETFKF